MGVPGRSYALPAAVGVFNGDWYDGSVVYKEWALKQSWVPAQPLYARKDVPEWLKKTSVSLRAEGDPKREYERTVAYRDFFGRSPALLNWYGGWFKSVDGKTCGQAPEWAENGLPEMKRIMPELRQKDIRTLVYSLLFLWDTRLPSWQKEGLSAAQLDAKGELMWGRYEGLPLAYVCTASKVYQDKFVNAMAGIAREFGADGVYADLAGCQVSELCFNPVHGHPVGGGATFAEGERSILEKSRLAARKYNPDFVVMAEAPDERILNSFDTYLIYQGFFEGTSRNIPMFNVVYGEYVRSYGAKSAGILNSPQEAINPAQLFVWGGMLGRVFLADPRNMPTDTNLNYLKYLARYRDAALPYLGFGKMLRPVKIGRITPPLKERPVEDYSVETATYLAPDGTVAFVFANTRLSTDITVACSIKPAEYNIPEDGSWTLCLLDETGVVTERAAIKGREFGLSEKIGKLKALVLVAKPGGKGVR